MSTPDLYPSRTGDAARVLPRKDPVVHGAPERAAGPLSPAELERFDRTGFLALESFVDEALVRELQEESERVRGALAGTGAAEVIAEPGSGEVRSVFAIHRSSAPFARLLRHPRVLGAAQQILGSRAYVHQSRINYKPAFRGREFQWHSDFETWHAEDGMPQMRCLSASIALTENTEFNGPLMVVPGSQRTFVACAGATPEDNYQQSLQMQEAGTPDLASLKALVDAGGIVAPKGPAGSVVLFECNVMHASTENLSPYPRSNAFFVYNSLENRLVEPFAAPAPRPPYIATREFTPLDRLG